ncbi:2-oxo-4-hydroxy-4-carboxy-5-ureidoimidazoline decarboxylase [Nocardioides marmotae]|uniref:2-oxo-4-hydroxy-4-carboxy-5-ureidoimidazoline decarboxylase n=1 Tax=Nocardioides marmotae TaxID=2663857 RepID=UPI0013230958|nr:2-oxo-4-hydroxy-4-carboxy-5-ureidoimidazoline decarboxylase [Nocardioides marmotae]MBC9734992.1 2-oxo-4-hydroxy-4-carboxy-5-ureidoimidazoline decarboxylase [Nocardioides marmotae]MTB86092.1 2-oxo-4-hydroxy-4-carboxy-5-ureidoimidazoline decarboxylase [Nocardioides marmotae]
MRIEQFNTMGEAEAADAVRPCAAIASWVDAVVADRPYADVDALVAHADALAATWTGAEVEQALADHPRIGERHAGDGASAAMSRREQSGVAGDGGADADLARRIAAGNAAYEQRFGRVFLVRAAGRSAAEILEQLEQRLAHDPTTELEVTRGQLAEIAALRLRGLFG